MAGRTILPPYGGVANNTSFCKTPELLCPPGSMLNVVPFDVSKDRPRIGQRRGLRALFATVMGGGRDVRELGVIPRAAAITGYTLGACTPISGVSRPAGALSGQVWMLDAEPAMFDSKYLNVTTLAGDASNSVQAIDFHPDGQRFAVISNYADLVTSFTRFVVAMYRMDGTLLWVTPIADPARDRFADSLLVTDNHVVVCSNEFVLVMQADTGAHTQTIDLSLVARQTIQACRTAAGVFVAFDGAQGAATLPGGTAVDSGIAAVHFRSGIAKFTLGTGPTPLSQVPFGNQLPPSDPFYETNHLTWRVSEQSNSRPRGCQMNGIAACPDGSIVFIRTNQGIGPNTTYPPNGSTPYISVCKVSAAGALLWEADSDSIREAMTYNAATYYNDIAGTADATPDPSLLAIAIDTDGDLYVGGRQNAGGASVFKLGGSDGRILWGANLQNSAGTAAIRQGCAAIDPRDGNPIFGGDRNTDWDGGGGHNANLWKLNKGNGGVLWSYDLGQAVSALGVDVNAAGQVVYVTDKL